MQHYHTFTERLGKFPVTIDYINRFRTKKEQKETLHKLQNGQVDIIVGTHRLLSKDVVFKDLGLIIIDEEHKFGVGDKEKLRVLRSTVDTLALTATPIPRTLQFSLLGIRDFSVISTPPPNRQPVDTIIEVFDPAVIRDAVAYELSRNGQVYYIHNRVKDLEEIGALIKQLVPDARVAIAHGQQEAEAIEETMLRFIDHKFDVLVCTTIVESGLDIPNANTIIISQAHTYGLSVLHQMRGRVGRSNRKAFCYLLAPPQHILTTDARKRLQAIEEFSDLGSGFQISMRDMDIRGAGDILGKEQSGFIADIGYDTYHKLLDEAIQELLDENPDELAPLLENSPHRRKVGAGDCHVDTDLQVLIPDTYIANTAERLDFYKRISEAQTEADLQALLRELRDRFGLVPTPVFDLFDTVRIREAAKRVGFEKVTFIDGKLRCTFISDPAHGFFRTPVFEAVLAYCQENGKKVLLKQNGKHLQLQRAGLRTLKEAWFAVKELADFVAERTAPVGVLAPGAGESGT
jgi:transcription-repair coupling factor (superfamily II helicase)